jgi:hypothetical protein
MRVGERGRLGGAKRALHFLSAHMPPEMLTRLFLLLVFAGVVFMMVKGCTER